MPPSMGPSPTALAVLAHDLRSALSASSAYVDLARERMAAGEASEDDLDLVQRGLDRINEVLARLDGLAKGATA